MKRGGAALGGVLLVVAPLALAHHLDPGNTQISFEIERLGLQWFRAGFHELSGEFTLEPDGHGGRLTVVVHMGSIDARSSYWNERLRSPALLDTGRFPEMVYRSERIELDGAQRATVHGELTLHGVTRPLELRLSEIDCPLSAPGPPQPCRFLGRARLKRSEYGIPHGFWQGGDAVEIVLRGI